MREDGSIQSDALFALNPAILVGREGADNAEDNPSEEPAPSDDVEVQEEEEEKEKRIEDHALRKRDI